jgi:6-phosphogluconolactonase (cycloisomerase 2 family)
MFETSPIDSIQNADSNYTLINSVAFHPHRNTFCATFTTSEALRLYRIEQSGKARFVQKLCNPKANLSGPQHAVFTPDGNKIIVVNWVGESLAVYGRGFGGRFRCTPLVHASFPREMAGYKPHGMEISPSGKFLAIAFGAALSNPTAIALFRVGRCFEEFNLLDLLDARALNGGIPKGICFSPDETALLVSFSNINSIAVYGFDPVVGSVASIPLQILGGPSAALARPEDIKLTRDKSFVVVSNSAANQIAFFSFDSIYNQIALDCPVWVLADVKSRLDFPHGIAFSPKGEFMVVSHFGPLPTTEDENIVFSSATPREHAKITIYRALSSSGDADLLELRP